MDGEPSREEQQDNQQRYQENHYNYLFLLFDECSQCLYDLCGWPRLGFDGVDVSQGAHHLLKASFTFSPACFRLPLVWSALPSARSLSLPLSFPAASFIFPLPCWALFFALSVVVMSGPSFGM